MFDPRLGVDSSPRLDFAKSGADQFRENIIKWDMAETAKGGPFKEILDGALSESVSTLELTVIVDIFVNCIYLSQPIPKFITSEFIEQAGEDRRLSVVVDVSCE